ncbi:MAG: PEP-CTERM sorting domain-containing protein [Planctomycetota bacterium]
MMLGALMSFAPPASAIVIAGGGINPAPLNNTAPANDPGWDRVGMAGSNGTGVYLGNGYVLTARHVASKTTLVIDGQTYTRLSTDTGTDLTNDNPGLTTTTDLHLFRVAVPEGTGLHGLDPLAISDSLLGGSGQTGTVIGTGRTQQEQVPVNFGGALGFNVGDVNSREKRWGIMEAGQAQTVTSFSRDVVAYRSTFNNIANEAMGVDRDSGSPVFFDTGSGFELGGMVFAIAVFNGQPSNTALFNNVTFIADLAEYRDQLLTYNGDLTGDQAVDENDLALVLNRFGQQVTAGHYELGDGTGDGRVDIQDLNLVLTNWNAAGPAPTLEEALASVPEPSSLGLLAAGALALFRRRRG